MNGGRHKPSEGDTIYVQRHDSGKALWHEATVTSVLSMQFGYVTNSGLRDLMLYASTEWRYPQEPASE